jgi:PAS domain S-box-containing protein
MQKLQYELMTMALEQARFGLCVVDESGRIVFANTAFAEKLRISTDEILGQGYLSLQRSLGRHPSFYKLFGVKAEEISIEFKLETIGEKPRYLLLQSKNVLHNSGEQFRTISAIDITDYGISRDKLLELQRQVEALNNAVVIVDAKSTDMTISYVNAEFERMTGYPSNEAVGRNCRFLQRENKSQPGLAVLREAIQKRESCQVRLLNYRKDGTPFDNELFVSPVFDELGELTHFIGIQREIRQKSSAGLTA